MSSTATKRQSTTYVSGSRGSRRRRRSNSQRGLWLPAVSREEVTEVRIGPKQDPDIRLLIAIREHALADHWRRARWPHGGGHEVEPDTVGVLRAMRRFDRERAPVHCFEETERRDLDRHVPRERCFLFEHELHRDHPRRRLIAHAASVGP